MNDSQVVMECHDSTQFGKHLQNMAFLRYDQAQPAFCSVLSQLGAAD